MLTWISLIGWSVVQIEISQQTFRACADIPVPQRMSPIDFPSSTIVRQPFVFIKFKVLRSIGWITKKYSADIMVVKGYIATSDLGDPNFSFNTNTRLTFPDWTKLSQQVFLWNLTLMSQRSITEI